MESVLAVVVLLLSGLGAITWKCLTLRDRVRDLRRANKQLQETILKLEQENADLKKRLAEAEAKIAKYLSRRVETRKSQFRAE